MALLQAPFHSASSPAEDQRTCPECLTRYTPAQDVQLFCCPAHRDTWNNRWTKRGRQGMILAAVARYSRNGSRAGGRSAHRASARLDRLLRDWRREDAAEGRMSIIAYTDLRYALGFDAL